MKKPSNLNQIRNMRYLLLFFIMVDLASAKSFGDLVTSLLDFLNNGFMKAVGVLICIGIGIYMVKQHDRIKEILVTCIVIILGTLAITNSQAIANLIW